MATLQALQKSLDALVRWSPEFERGYDWSVACQEMSPVLLHGTTSANAINIASGLPGRQDYAELLDYFREVCERYGLEFPSYLTPKAEEDSSRTYFLLHPGKAWAYAHKGSEAREPILKLYMNLASRKISIKSSIRGQIRQLKDGTKEKPALVLAQMPTELLGGPGADVLKDGGPYRRMFDMANDREDYVRMFPDSPEMRLCAMLRDVLPDFRFNASPVGSELYTTHEIDARYVIGILE